MFYHGEVDGEAFVTALVLLPGHALIALIPFAIGSDGTKRHGVLSRASQAGWGVVSLALLGVLALNAIRLWQNLGERERLDAVFSEIIESLPTRYEPKSDPEGGKTLPAPFVPIEVGKNGYHVSLHFESPPWPIAKSPAQARSIVVINNRPEVVRRYTAGVVDAQWVADVWVLDRTLDVLSYRSFKGDVPADRSGTTSYGSAKSSYGKEVFPLVKAYLRSIPRSSREADR